MKQQGLFDIDERLRKLSKLGDPLEKLNAYIDWEQFRGKITKVFKKEPKGPGGSPPFDYIMMFKSHGLRALGGRWGIRAAPYKVF